MGFNLVATNTTGATMRDDIVRWLSAYTSSEKNYPCSCDVFINAAADEIKLLRRTIVVLQYELEAKEDAQNE
jgi:hypothetical protein